MVNVQNFQTLYSVLFRPKLLFIHLFHQRLSERANSVDPELDCSLFANNLAIFL